jgi:hypothetical protein
LIEFITIWKEDFEWENYYQNQDQFKSLKTDDSIRNRVNECFDYYNNSSDGLDLNQILNYFFGSKDSLAIKAKNPLDRSNSTTWKKEKSQDILRRYSISSFSM